MNREIQVFLIGSSQPHTASMVSWLTSIGVKDPVGYVEQLQGLTGTEIIVGLAAKSCYKSFEVGLNRNISRVRKDWVDFFDNILGSRHGSVLEHATFTFAIEGCTRVFTAEMNRHRAGVAISEQSLRYIAFDDIPYWLPNSIQYNSSDTMELSQMKERMRSIFCDVFSAVEEKYEELISLLPENMPFSEKKKWTSLARRIVPMGVSTGAIYTINVRALRHILALRATPEAEEEIVYVMGLIGEHILNRELKLFGDFKRTEEGFLVPTYVKV